MINAGMRDILIEHIDGPTQFVVRNPSRNNRIRGCVASGLLRYDTCIRAKQTFITKKGRQVLAEALADWADALKRSGLEHEEVILLSLAYKSGEVTEAKHLDEVGELALGKRALDSGQR